MHRHRTPEGNLHKGVSVLAAVRVDEVIPGRLSLLQRIATQVLERLLLRSQGETTHGQWVGTPELPIISSIKRALDRGTASGACPIQPSICDAPNPSELTLPSKVGFDRLSADHRSNPADWLVRKRPDFGHVIDTLTGCETLTKDEFVIAMVSTGYIRHEWC